MAQVSGTVLRAAGDIQHFQVVMVGIETNRGTSIETSEQQPIRAVAHFYSSETGAWGDLISTTIPPSASTDQLTTIVEVYVSTPCVLAGNSLYWWLSTCLLRFDSLPGILEFDLDRQRLNVIPMPGDIYVARTQQVSVTRADGGGLGFLFMSDSDFVAQLWKRKTNCYGVASWVLGRTIELDKLLSLNSEEIGLPKIKGYAKENNTLVLLTVSDIFLVHLESLQFKKFFQTNVTYQWHPVESVYTAGMGIDDGNDGAELLHNT